MVLITCFFFREENIDACANASDDKKNHKNNFPQAEMHSKSAKSDIKFKRSDSIFKCKSQEPINNLKKRQKDSNSSSFKSFQLQKHKKEPFSKVTKKKEQFSEFERRKNVEKEEASVLGISDARLESYGINPKKLKNKLKYGSKKTTSKDST